MASIIGAGTTAGTSLNLSGDTTGVLQFATNGTTTAMTIDTSQRVGIGTSSPTAPLQIQAVTGGQALRLQGRSSDGYASIEYRDNASSTSYAFVDANNAAMYMGTPSSLPIITYTNGVERMRINSSGRVLINNPTSGTQPLTVQADTGNAAASFYSEKAAGNATDIVYFYSLNKGALIGYIGYNGSQVTYNATSDYRLKENVAPMTGALAKVAQLKPCTYTWKQNNTNGQGFIAHELADVFPEAVSGKKDELFEDGSIKPQGIDTSFLVATLTAAIQELKAELDATKAEVAALKGA